MGVRTRSLRVAALDKTRLGNHSMRVVTAKLVRFGQRTQPDWDAYNRGVIDADGGVPRKPMPVPDVRDIDDAIRHCQVGLQHYEDALDKLRAMRYAIVMGAPWR